MENNMNKNMNKCPHCKSGYLSFGFKSQIHTYKSNTFTVNQPGDWCDNCPEGVLSGADIKATCQEIRDIQASIDRLLTSRQIKEIRNRLGLTQKEAASICGGGPNAFSRYESGKATVSRATSNLLLLLSKYPEEVKKLLQNTDNQ